MFCTMFIGLPPATGFAAPTPMHALGENRPGAVPGERRIDSITAWRLVSMPQTARRPRSCLPHRAHSLSRSEALERPRLPVGWKRGTLRRWPPPIIVCS
eukprot:5078372-Prymnesium_polylepis.1